MFPWPELKLTEYERKFVSLYKEVDDSGKVIKPGVAGRSYQLQLANQAQPSKNIPAVKMASQITIARRSRVFAITFSGNTDAYCLAVRNTNGTQYTNAAQRSGRYPVVSSLIAGSYYNALALGGKLGASPEALAYNHASNISPGIGPNPGFSNQFMSGIQSMPWLIEPNWVLMPNETLIFQATDISPQWALNPGTGGVIDGPYLTLPTVLNITVYAWEFEKM